MDALKQLVTLSPPEPEPRYTWPCLWTVGHSTRSIDIFIKLLKAHEITLLVDVRIIPYSRRHPQFQTASLAVSLQDAGLRYHHLAALGGRRKSQPDSINLGWRNAGFRGYADYMQTELFEKGLEELTLLAEATRTVVMCAEALPWRCHRSLIGDALVSRGWEVRHIVTTRKADVHTLPPFARLDNLKLSYPAPSDQERTSHRL